MPVPAKLAAAWTSFMFLYIYVDYFSLYKPGFLDQMRAGRVHEFDISVTFAVLGISLVGIPSLMVLLSITLPARVNRVTNLVIPAVAGAPLSAAGAEPISKDSFSAASEPASPQAFSRYVPAAPPKEALSFPPAAR
mgnify:CR=1 FL=1